MSEPRITWEKSGDGRIVLKAVDGGVLITRDGAVRIAERIGELEAIVRDLFFELDWLRLGLTTLGGRRRQINDVCERARSLVEVEL